MLRAKLSYCWVLRFESPAQILLRFSDLSPSSCGYRLLVRSRLRGVFVAQAVVPHLASRFAGFVFDLPSFPIAVTVFVCPCCVTTRRLWLPSPCRTGLCSVFLCLLMCRLLVLFVCLDLHLPRILCQGCSSVLAGSPRPSGSDYGVREGFFPPSVEATLLLAWSFPSFDCSQRVYPSCFPFSVPSF